MRSKIHTYVTPCDFVIRDIASTLLHLTSIRNVGTKNSGPDTYLPMATSPASVKASQNTLSGSTILPSQASHLSQLPTQSGADSVAPTIEAATSTISESYPSPDLFTFIPEIYRTISRLSILRPSASGTNHNENQDHALSTTLSRESRHSNGTTVDSSNGVIEAKDLPAHFYAVRQKIAKAKDRAREVPDGKRTVEEQEKEVRMLEGRVRALKGRLGELGRIAELEAKTAT